VLILVTNTCGSWFLAILTSGFLFQFDINHYKYQVYLNFNSNPVTQTHGFETL